MKVPRIQFSLRKLLWAFTGCALLAAYWGSYYRLSRQYLAERDCLLFVTDAELQTEFGRTRHRRLKRFFRLAHWLDSKFTEVPSLADIELKWTPCELSDATLVLVIEHQTPGNLQLTDRDQFPQLRRFVGVPESGPNIFIINDEYLCPDGLFYSLTMRGCGPTGGSNSNILVSVKPDWSTARANDLRFVSIDVKIEYKHSTTTQKSSSTDSQRLCEKVEVWNGGPPVERTSQDIRFAAALVSPDDVSRKLLSELP